MTDPEKDIWRKEVLHRCAETTYLFMFLNLYRKRCNETLAKSEETKKIIAESDAASRRLEAKWQEFQDQFKRTMEAIVGSIGESLGGKFIYNLS